MNSRWGLPGIAAIAIVVSMACQAPVAPERVTCDRVYNAACEVQGDQIAARWPGRVVEVALRCETALCGRARGAGIALVTFGDGSSTTTRWAYEGDPGPVPSPDCVGLDRELCRLAYAYALDAVPPDWPLAGARVTCVGRCAVAEGEVKVEFELADGTSQSMVHSWSGGMEMPSPGIGAEIP